MCRESARFMKENAKDTLAQERKRWIEMEKKLRGSSPHKQCQN